MTPPPSRSTLFPYTTLFRSSAEWLLGLYRGTFLREDEAEPWSVTTRERLRSRFIHALGVETGRLEREGRFDLAIRSEEHTSELQSLRHLVCRLLLEKKKTQK